jgi:hypothetical protein
MQTHIVALQNDSLLAAEWKQNAAVEAKTAVEKGMMAQIESLLA